MRTETFTADDALPWLIDQPGSDDHKYTRGVLGVRTGSAQFPGAAALGVEAAWRTGLGMVRFLPLEPLTGGTPAADPLCQTVLHRRPETVFTEGRTDAWLVGSGVSDEVAKAHGAAVLKILLGGSAPLIIDAGTLAAVAQHPVTAPTLITPHADEFSKLVRMLDLERANPEPPELGQPGSKQRTEDALGDSVLETMCVVAKQLGVTVLLKGSITHVVTPHGRHGQVGPATGWLATAGTGDVLAAILGALAARHHDAITTDPELMLDIALSAALLHDSAARHASLDGATPVTALDVAEAIPHALLKLHTFR